MFIKNKFILKTIIVLSSIFILLLSIGIIFNIDKNSLIVKISQRSIDEIQELIFRQFDKDYWEVEDNGKRKELPKYTTIKAINIDSATSTSVSSNPTNLIKWHRSNQNDSSLRFSALDQVNSSNVNELELAWMYDSGDIPDNLGSEDTIQANPIVVNGVIYTPTISGHIVAVNAVNGKEIWRYAPPSKRPAQRGLIYIDTKNINKGRIFFTSGRYLVSLNSSTGKPNKNFGSEGVVKLSSVSKTTPIIFDNQVVILNFKPSIESFNIDTGKSLWSFPLNKKSKTKNGGKKSIVSAGNPWSGASLDKNRGILFFSRGNPRPDWVGVQRPGDNKHSNSVVAFDLKEQKILWQFQEVRHDIWDHDVSSYPILTSITKGTKKIDVVVTLTKSGNTLILDRISGKPIFDFRMRKAKSSTIPGEKTALYQPDLITPEPFSKQEFSLNEVTNIGVKNHKSVMDRLKNATFGWYEPHSFKPGAHESNDLVLFGLHGGASWPGASVDPRHGIIYISSNDIPWKVKLSRKSRKSLISKLLMLVKLKLEPGHDAYNERCSNCHGDTLQGVGSAPDISYAYNKYSKEKLINIITNGFGAMPQVEDISDNEANKIVSYIFNAGKIISNNNKLVESKPWSYEYYNKYFSRFEDYEGYPASKPPWGSLTALDLNTGLILWTSPLGEYDDLSNRNIQITGMENHGGATATAGNLIFVAGTLDKKFRAFDSLTGEELWSFKMPHAGVTPPTIYEVNGKQYVLITSSGGGVLFDSDPKAGKHGSKFLSFRLSD